MKQLSVREKAKAYDETLERAKKVLLDCTLEEQKVVEYIIPELEENNDERIRKNCIHFLELHKRYRASTVEIDECIDWLEKQCNTNETINKDEFAQGILRGAAINLITWIDYNAAEGNMCLSNMECKDIENALVSGNWDKIYNYIKKKLERQGEKKSTDNVKPKFYKGEWLVNIEYGNIVRVFEVLEDNYRLDFGGNTVGTFCKELVENDYRLWNISDAKDGDVLAFDDDTIIIFKNLYNSTTFHSYCHVEEGTFNVSQDDMPDWWKGKGFHPATKEQCDQLEKAMTDAGYEWDIEKKELKKID